MKKVENLMHKSTQYCADTTKTGSVHAVDMRGYKHYLQLIINIFKEKECEIKIQLKKNESKKIKFATIILMEEKNEKKCIFSFISIKCFCGFIWAIWLYFEYV